MEFYELVKNNHSVKSFSEKRLENKKLAMIVESALSSPSMGDLQSYKMYMVRSEEAKEGLMIAADYQEYLTQAQIILVFCADQRRSGAQFGGRGEDLYSVQDATLAAVYAQLAANTEGLSTSWIGEFEPLEVARIVNAASFEVPVVMLAVGYSDEKEHEFHRRPVKEMVKEV